MLHHQHSVSLATKTCTCGLPRNYSLSSRACLPICSVGVQFPSLLPTCNTTESTQKSARPMEVWLGMFVLTVVDKTTQHPASLVTKTCTCDFPRNHIPSSRTCLPIYSVVGRDPILLPTESTRKSALPIDQQRLCKVLHKFGGLVGHVYRCSCRWHY